MPHDHGDPAGDRGGGAPLLPPDGVAWPPEPAAPAPAPQVPELPPAVARRPAGAEIADWRSLPVEAPHGYRGSATAPPTPTARIDPWSVVSFLAALLGVLPLLWSVPLAPVFAVGFGLAGRRVCALDPTRRGKPLATIGVLVGGATLLGVAGAVATGSLTLFG